MVPDVGTGRNVLRPRSQRAFAAHVLAGLLPERATSAHALPPVAMASRGAAADMEVVSVTPIPMRIPCPECGELHIDEGEFATKPHHTHSCQHCGLTWRPAVVPTVGVRFLPGFKNP